MIIDTNCYDQDTLHKVYRVLKAIGMSYENQTTIVSELQKAGILFRERLPEESTIDEKDPENGVW